MKRNDICSCSKCTILSHFQLYVGFQLFYCPISTRHISKLVVTEDVLIKMSKRFVTFLQKWLH